jgi:hypothetical protein
MFAVNKTTDPSFEEGAFFRLGVIGWTGREELKETS